MRPERKSIEAHLKARLIPELKLRGFSGRFPHLRRDRSRQMDLLSFQFFSLGDSFCIEVGCASEEKINSIVSEGCAREKINAHLTPNRRLKYRNSRSIATDAFVFAVPGLLEAGEEHLAQRGEQICHMVLKLIEIQAEQWWANPELLLPRVYMPTIQEDLQKLPSSEVL